MRDLRPLPFDICVSLGSDNRSPEQQVGLANDVLLRSEKVQLVSVVQFVAMGFLTRFWACVFPELLLFAEQLESA